MEVHIHSTAQHSQHQYSLVNWQFIFYSAHGQCHCQKWSRNTFSTQTPIKRGKKLCHFSKQKNSCSLTSSSASVAEQLSQSYGRGGNSSDVHWHSPSSQQPALIIQSANVRHTLHNINTHSEQLAQKGSLSQSQHLTLQHNPTQGLCCKVKWCIH